MNNFIGKQVNVTLAITQEEVDKNISENLVTIPNWYGQLFYPNGYEAIILSAGPSLEKYVEELNLVERMKNPNRGFVTFCVKHALPRLVAMGVEPDFCVVLDGREFNKDSTHGVNRKSLFEVIPDKTIFLVASMTHPDYANHLLGRGARVLGWHTAVTGIEKFIQSGQIVDPVINGGTSSGTRCISIANTMGIRDVTLVGFDSCIHEATPEVLAEKDDKGRIKYMPVDLPMNPSEIVLREEETLKRLEKEYLDENVVFQFRLLKRFYTTGELLAQAQDFEVLFTKGMNDVRFKVLDDGIVGHMFRTNRDIPVRGFSFIDYIRNICPRKNASKYPKYSVVVKSNPRKVVSDSSICYNMSYGIEKEETL